MSDNEMKMEFQAFSTFCDCLKEVPEEQKGGIMAYVSQLHRMLGESRARIKTQQNIIARLQQETNREEGWFVGKEVHDSWYIEPGSGSIVVKDRQVVPESELRFTDTSNEDGPAISLRSIAAQLYSPYSVLTVFECYSDGKDARVHQFGLDGSKQWHTFRMSHFWPDNEV